jgi:hypothetical protein
MEVGGWVGVGSGWGGPPYRPSSKDSLYSSYSYYFIFTVSPGWVRTIYFNKGVKMFLFIFISLLAVISLCIVEVHNREGVLSAEEYITGVICVFGITTCVVILGFIGYIYL